MNLLEKICFGFLIMVLSILSISAILIALILLWVINPFAYIFTFLIISSIIYLTRDSNFIPK